MQGAARLDQLVTGVAPASNGAAAASGACGDAQPEEEGRGEGSLGTLSSPGARWRGRGDRRRREAAGFRDGERRPEVREMGSGRRTTGPGLDSSEEKGHRNTAEAMERSAGLGEARSGGAVRRGVG